MQKVFRGLDFHSAAFATADLAPISPRHTFNLHITFYNIDSISTDRITNHLPQLFPPPTPYHSSTYLINAFVMDVPPKTSLDGRTASKEMCMHLIKRPHHRQRTPPATFLHVFSLSHTITYTCTYKFHPGRPSQRLNTGSAQPNKAFRVLPVSVPESR
ncbi:hypothetical protein CC78DRAFT_576099 [Lojkania enalia]|uniref:Uncharacterized protein n=1 Tax=Lojkania enalia TaxID=147567 RepID=A0A9P4KJP3_9PLEO|nr:hypothetical protein CC78DRAFT_576099 [Didymosphaeria enalia]